MADVSSIKYSSSASVNVKYPQGRADIKDIQMYIGMDDPHMTGIYADFTNNIFRRIGGGALLQPGSDFDIYNMYGKRGRCTVDDFGNITSRYGDNDYVEDGSMGQVMVYQPKFYYKVIPMKTSTDTLGNTVLDCGIYYISDEKLDGFKCHPAFIDDTGNETDGYFIGAFDSTFYDVSESEYRLYDTWEVEHTEGTTTYRVVAHDAYPADADTDILASIAGAKPVTEKRSPEFTRTGAQRMANRRGSKWGIMDLKIYSAEQLLFAVEYGSFNAQNEIGMGSVSMDLSSENISLFSGSTVGNTTGQADTSYGLGSNGIYSTYRVANYPNRVAVNYRGAENLWGNTRKLINGVTVYGNNNNQAGKVYICNTHSFDEDQDDYEEGYEDTRFTLPYSTTYISRFGYNANFDWAFIPVGATGANSNLPVGDTLESESDHLNGYDKLSVGGYNRAGYGAGMFSWYTRNRANNMDQYTSARLVRYDSTPASITNMSIGPVLSQLNELDYYNLYSDSYAKNAVGFRIYGDEWGTVSFDTRMHVHSAPSADPDFIWPCFPVPAKLYDGEYTDAYNYRDLYESEHMKFYGVIADVIAALGDSDHMSLEVNCQMSLIYPEVDVGEIIDLTEGNYQLTQKDHTAIGLRIYGDADGVAIGEEDEYYEHYVNIAADDFGYEHAALYIGKTLYTGDWIDVYSASDDGGHCADDFYSHEDYVIFKELLEDSETFSLDSDDLHQVRKFSFLYPKT